MARLHRFLLVIDERGCIVWRSEQLAELCGDELVEQGSSLWRLLPDIPTRGDQLQLQQRLRDLGQLSSVRVRLPRSGGSAAFVDVSAFSVPQCEPEEAPDLTVVIFRPISDNDTGDRSSRRGLEFERTVLDACPSAVLAFDRSSFITYANTAAEALLGEQSSALEGRPLALFLPHASGIGRTASSARHPGDMNDREFELRRSDGRHLWVSISTRPLRDDAGAIAGGVAQLHEVTRARDEFARLEQQNAELESTLHGISHDLRSPLVSLLGFTRLLQQDYAGRLDETGHHFLDRIEQSGRNMETLLRDLLELSRIGRPGDHRTWVDPRAVLLQIQAELKPRLEERDVSLQLPASPSLVLCDRTRLYQVLSNLIGNALDHMGPCAAPEIVVEVLEEEDQHRIVVRDNGRGIPRSEQQRIFEVFQTAGPRCDGRRSSGIGLAIVKKIAEAHDGRAWVESEPQRGAAFHVVFPT